MYQHEVLDLYLFTTLKEVNEMTESWIKTYNTEQPHDSLNDMMTMQYKLTA